MAVKVYKKSDGSIVVEVSGTKLTLSGTQARVLLKKLADLYGYKLSPSRPIVRASIVAPGLVKIILHEGRSAKTYVVPLYVFDAFISVLRGLGPGRHEKREIASRVFTRLLDRKDIAKRIEKYFASGVFDWEKFFGARNEYYELYRAPILVLDKLGLIVERQGRYLEVTEKILDTTRADRLLRNL